ncbi:DEAD/DEAH box helicase family protein [Parabacteroides acidifaciens]|uniref:DEAD/DEAH box helicase family protein n=1 Tax=Parabacteroides acidifaciens TaxID=2290935 RepID=A0A3D8HAY9_9BACT|nr:DEAD/DEAH box helicase family protein [Parabacteroides acidifaciens]MBC8603146.1 DEAD/DEAH box helicase family protein [Parabacteroides acidifaciens]RDU48149.1 hypothetical protein DWU89_16025 [Parabacteroides acidifaciens]
MKLAIQEKRLKLGQFIEDIYPDGLPSDMIINKVVTGIGATTCEINSYRHSIIVVPNLPVIKNKMKKHPQIFGVYGGVSPIKIQDYLSNENIEWKKILTTPESYELAKNAITDTKFNLYEDFFMLIDECEKIIQEANFREKIITPFFDFFKFNAKSLISATPLYAKLKGFEKDLFNEIRIVPEYDYKKDLHLTFTNNIIEAMREHATGTNIKAIFLNSVKYALKLIEELGIQKESNLYTSPDSIKEIKANNKNIAVGLYDEFTGNLQRYNFFTSRYYSAVDLDTDIKPDIIMISDFWSKPQTIIDPYTHAIQITGRFRNGNGSITHIVKTNDKVSVRSEKEIRESLTKQKAFWEAILTLQECADPAVQPFIDEILERTTFGSVIFREGEYQGKLNGFIVTNMIEKERVRDYYTASSKLCAAYKQTEHFNLSCEHKKYATASGFIGAKRLTKDEQRILLAQLRTLKPETPEGEAPLIMFLSPEQSDKLNEIILKAPLLYQVYSYAGSKAIERVNFDNTRMRKLLEKQEQESKYLSIMDEVLSAFKIGNKYTEEEIISKLQRIYAKHERTANLKVAATNLKHYFELGRRTTVKRINGKEIKGYEIKAHKYFRREDDWDTFYGGSI